MVERGVVIIVRNACQSISWNSKEIRLTDDHDLPATFRRIKTSEEGRLVPVAHDDEGFQGTNLLEQVTRFLIQPDREGIIRILLQIYLCAYVQNIFNFNAIQRCPDYWRRLW